MNMIILFVALILFILIGVPIGYSLGGAGIIYFLIENPSFLMSVPQRVFAGLNSFILIAMPLFMLSGELMNHGGLTKRLINFALLICKPFRGGLGEVNVVASMIFGGITGSSVADTSALGSILIPDMTKQGYSKEFSTGITVASSTVGMIIPPSIPMLMFAMVSGVSVGKLFMGGVLPGIFIGLFQLVVVWLYSEKKGYHRIEAKVDGSKARVVIDGLVACLMPLMILVFTTFGITTASESAAVAVVYSLIVGRFFYKELKWKHIVAALKKTAIMTATIMIIGGFTNVFTYILAIKQVPLAIANLILNSSIPVWVIFLLFDVLVLALGTFLDVVPCILLIAPILLPVFTALGMSEITFGMILVVGLAIGLVTPPVGMCLNVGSKISGMSIMSVFRASSPFLLCNICVLLLVTFVPAVSTWLPSLLA
ncbi:MAG: TRAP transporter large permease [Bullifex sp.]|nr:TRAP transporter large permease [Bullifex sp.]MDY5908225.1 TRAP transporter large permease [Bullifex sp.]